MTSKRAAEPVRVGVIGLGRAFVLMLPAFRASQRVRLVAAADLRSSSGAAFVREFGGTAYNSVEELCADQEVEAVYIATPHQLHAAHVAVAATAGKHILVEKPLAVTLEDGLRMVSVCTEAGVKLIVGPSHSVDGPIMTARRIISSGRYGAVRMIHAFNYTDFIYRPRRPEELRTEQGGGVVFSQGVHQIDIVRALAGGVARDVFAMTCSWDPRRPTEGSYSALIGFEDCFASVTYSGYAHFDSDEWMNWVGEFGRDKDPTIYGEARRALQHATVNDEIALKAARTYPSGEQPFRATHHAHFGPIIIGCEDADLRLDADGVHVYGDDARLFAPALKTAHPREEVLEALAAAARGGNERGQTGAWGLGTLEICHAILQSARTRERVLLAHQA